MCDTKYDIIDFPELTRQTLALAAGIVHFNDLRKRFKNTPMSYIDGCLICIGLLVCSNRFINDLCENNKKMKDRLNLICSVALALSIHSDMKHK